MVHPITNHRNEFTLTEWNYQVVYMHCQILKFLWFTRARQKRNGITLQHHRKFYPKYVLS